MLPVLDYSTAKRPPGPPRWARVMTAVTMIGIGVTMVVYGVGYLWAAVELQRIAPFDSSGFFWTKAVANYAAVALTMLPGLYVVVTKGRELLSLIRPH